MGQRTKISWCDSTWSPVTGCLHGCEYCYARKIAERFSCEGQTLDASSELQRIWLEDGGTALRQNGCHDLRYPVNLLDSGRKCAYPFGFMPTFHRYKLDEPQHWKNPRNIFVCSMADLFGDWVPDEWIKTVFEACEKAPQHRYLFLTKNPKRYSELYEKDIMPRGVKAWNKYFGCTITKPTDEYFYNNLYGNGIDHPGFLSIEPIMEDFDIGEFDKDEFGIKWIIVGAETGNRKGKIVPKREWIEHLSKTCRKSNVPLFMKESLRNLMGDDFRQEFPWEV